MTKTKKRKPMDGRCCACGYDGKKKSACPKREDKIHCEHWWDGAETPGGDAE